MEKVLAIGVPVLCLALVAVGIIGRFKGMYGYGWFIAGGILALLGFAIDRWK